MYKKCYTTRKDKKYYDEMNHYTVYERKEKIKNPKIGYFKTNDKIGCKMIIDENGMNFLIDNYPLLVKDLLVEIDKSEFDESIIYEKVKLKNGKIISDTITKKVVGYKFISYNSKNEIIEEEDYGKKLLGIDKWGNLNFWDCQKQRIIVTFQHLGLMGNRYYQNPDNRLRFNEKSLKKMFSPQYFENIKIGDNGKWIGKVLPKEKRNW